ncbi:UvrB/UvrC motif-containing protein, partial [Streptomyces hirsutus]
VADERYEQATQLRDRIGELKERISEQVRATAADAVAGGSAAWGTHHR